jgi:hypothetical protein
MRFSYRRKVERYRSLRADHEIPAFENMPFAHRLFLGWGSA